MVRVIHAVMPRSAGMRPISLAATGWLTILLLLSCAEVEAQARKVLVRIPSPPEGIISIQAGNGWPFTIRLISQGELGLSTPEPQRELPTAGDTAILLYTNPDGCPSWAAFGLNAAHSIDFKAFPDCHAPLPWPVDETHLRFTIDADSPGVLDLAGEPELQSKLTDSAHGGPPKVFTFDEHSRGLKLVTIGPRTGGNQKDGYGYGANDDLPGLVILSDTGPGVVVDSFFNLPTPREARNLAGFFEAVSFELNDAKRRTTVAASMIAPPGPPTPSVLLPGLFNPVVLQDDCVGRPNPSGRCPDPNLWRVDGGPVERAGNISERITTVRVFVVNGTAPARVQDLDGNGVVAARDVELAGYTLLSREAIVRFRQVFMDTCPFYGFPFDFDGNGRALSHVCAPGSVTLTRIPR